MSSIQRFLAAIVPTSWASSIEAESRAWMIRCPCGFEQSVWDMGGIRWKAAGNPKRYQLCRKCGQMHWHTVYRKGSEQAH